MLLAHLRGLLNPYKPSSTASRLAENAVLVAVEADTLSATELQLTQLQSSLSSTLTEESRSAIIHKVNRLLGEMPRTRLLFPVRDTSVAKKALSAEQLAAMLSVLQKYRGTEDADI